MTDPVQAKRPRGNPSWRKGGASPNPGGRRDAIDVPNDAIVPTSGGARFDGWFNLLTGIGTSARDKRKGTKFCVEPVPWDEAEELWRGDDLAARIIETLPNEMVREGATISITEDAEGNDDAEGGKDLAEIIADRWEDLDMWQALHEALCYERAYGGGAILLGANDAQDLALPLEIERVKSFDFLTTLMPHEVVPVEWYGDATKKKFGLPSHYMLSPVSPGASSVSSISLVGQRVHESRMIIFGGNRVSRRMVRGTMNGWGDSVLTRVHATLRDFNLSWSAAGILVVDFSQAVYKMKGLIDAVQKDIAEGKTPDFTARMIAMELGRSVARATLIDSEDEFERKTTNLAGLPDLLDRFATRLSAAADMPLQMLMGESPGGMNASGASGDQVRMWYDRAKAQQKRKLLPGIRKISRILMVLEGGEPDQWSIKFCSLWQATAKEEAETRKIQSSIDIEYIDRQVITPEDVQRSRFGGDEYSYATTVDRPKASDDATAEELAAFKANGRDLVGTGEPGAPAAPVEPGAPAGGTGAPVTTEIAKEAMNGAQISSLIEVVTSVNQKQVSRASGAAMLRLAFQLSPAEALELLGPEDFEPPAAPAPAGGGGGFGGPPTPPVAPTKAPE